MTTIPALFLQGDSDFSSAAGLGGLLAFSGVMMLICLAFLVVFIIAGWKVFTKAGKPGWAVLIPIYNSWVILQIVGRPGWWLLLLFIPIVNLVVLLIVMIDLAKSFGQSAVFGVVLLCLFSAIGWLVLGFGNYQYIGPAAATA